MSSLQILEDSAMGHSQNPPPTLTSMEQALKRHLESCDIDGAVKRRRVWLGETPPPSPTPSFLPHVCSGALTTSHENTILSTKNVLTADFDELSDEDEWSCDEDELESSPCASPALPPSSEADSANYRGSILASCLMADRPDGGGCNVEARQGACWWYTADSSPASSNTHSRLTNQTVECDGKSYIELGAMCPLFYPRQQQQQQRSQMYRQQRFGVLHSTMMKLARHRRLSDPRLRTSVLLYNTMRRIERELEHEGHSLAAAFNPHHADAAPAGLTLDPLPPPQSPASTPPHHGVTCQSAAPASSVYHTAVSSTSFTPSCTTSSTSSCSSSLATCCTHTPLDEPINWCSVLSIGSQPDLLLPPAVVVADAAVPSNISSSCHQDMQQHQDLTQDQCPRPCSPPHVPASVTYTTSVYQSTRGSTLLVL